MIERQIEIINKLGLHARAAMKLVDTAARFKSRIEVGKEGRFVDGKSIMSVMLLAASKGTLLDLKVDGEDEQKALDALCQLINNRFDEPE